MLGEEVLLDGSLKKITGVEIHRRFDSVERALDARRRREIEIFAEDVA